MPRPRNPNRRPLPRPGRPRRRTEPTSDAWLDEVIGGRRPANDNAEGSQVKDLAQAVAAARRHGVRWKELVQRYGYCRTRLWKLCRAAEARAANNDLPSAG